MSQYGLNCVLKFLFFPKRSVLSSIQNTDPTGSKALRKAIWHNFLPLQCNKSFVGNKVNANLTFVFFYTLCSWILIYLFILLYRRINIGSRFQADIPELQDRLLMEKDVHKATLVWKPWPELENKVFQQRGIMTCHFRSSYVSLCLLKKCALISRVCTEQNVQENINYWECRARDSIGSEQQHYIVAFKGKSGWTVFWQPGGKGHCWEVGYWTAW